MGGWGWVEVGGGVYFKWVGVFRHFLWVSGIELRYIFGEWVWVNVIWHERV